MGMTKPKEYWLQDVYTEQYGELLTAFKHCEHPERSIHVIEYSAIKEILEKLVMSVTKYHEYFGAIEVGEYEKNGRPAPLRDYETIMQDKAKSLLNECEELFK